MLARFLSSAADVLAPPATRLVEFQYHWKLLQNFYTQDDVSSKIHVENTKIPIHLHEMLQFLVDEEEEYAENIGPCLEQLMDSKIGMAACLTSLAEVDQPVGIRGTILSWYTALLRRVKKAPVHDPTLYRPIQKLLLACNSNHASPTEKEEVELLLTLCGIVRKEPKLATLFLSANYEGRFCATIPSSIIMRKPKKNKLFEFDSLPKQLLLKQISIVSQPNQESPTPNHSRLRGNSENESIASSLTDDKCIRSQFDENDRFLLMDLLLSYLSSADNHIVLRACEGIMIVASLPDDQIAHLIESTSPVCEYLIDILIEKYKALPPDTDPCDIDQLNITWGFATQEFSDKCTNCIGIREMTCFLSWLDYCDTLAKECHIILAVSLARTLRWHFLAAELELTLVGAQLDAVLVTALIGKCLKAIDSTELLNEMCRWLVGDCANVTARPASSVLQTLIDNCFDGNTELCLETLRLFETMLERASEHLLHCLVLGFLDGRGYHIPVRNQQLNEEEERERLNAQSLSQERERNKQTMKKVCSVHVDGKNWHNIACDTNSDATRHIHKIINSFLLILPRDLLSDPAGLGYEQYMQDANRHYLGWVEATAHFNWPSEAVWHDPSTSSTHSCDSRPEADLHMNCSPCSTYRRYKHKDSSLIADNSNSPQKSSTPCSSNDKKVETKTENCTHNEVDHMNHLFHQNLVLSPKDRCCLSEMAEDDEMVFDEGPFLKALYKMLLSMPNQPYQISLQLTAIFSKLAMMPHPYLHEYLLNPSLPTGKNVTTLYKTLQTIAKTFTTQIPKIKQFDVIIDDTRKRLLGEAPSEATDQSEKSDPLFECLIVIEEFCKELAAIAFVKFHHTSEV